MASKSSEPILSLGMQIMSQTIGSPLQSPFCARTYSLVLGSFTGNRLELALLQNDTAVLELLKGYLKFFLLFEDIAPALEDKLFHQPCQCALLPEFAPAHPRRSDGGLMGMSVQLRCGEERDINNPQSFVEVMCDLFDRVFAIGIQARHKTIPRSRAWWRELQELVRAHSPSFARTLCKWLKRSTSFLVFAFFGTILEMQGTDGLAVTSLMAVPQSLEVIDERLSALVTQQRDRLTGKPKASDELQPLDLIYHGAGCFAYALVLMHNQKSRTGQTVAYLSPGARQRYEIICALLQLVPYTCNNTQTGKAQDIIRLTVFAQRLEPLFPEPPSPLIAKLAQQWLPDSKRIGMHTFFTAYLHVIDRCHNVSAHATSVNHKMASQVEVAVSERVPKNQRLSACTGCLAARYCTVECQKADWKKGDPPHKSMCGLLKRLRLLQHDPRQRGAAGVRWIESEYDGFSDEDFGRLTKHIFEMMAYFSEQPLPEHLAGVFGDAKSGIIS